jgi:hypothetical protein
MPVRVKEPRSALVPGASANQSRKPPVLALRLPVLPQPEPRQPAPHPRSSESLFRYVPSVKQGGQRLRGSTIVPVPLSFGTALSR